jgi:hypothetical protein
MLQLIEMHSYPRDPRVPFVNGSQPRGNRVLNRQVLRCEQRSFGYAIPTSFSLNRQSRPATSSSRAAGVVAASLQSK